MPGTKFRVAICGAGIGGLTLAAYLSRSSDIVIDVYETKSEVSTIGAGIAIWKRSWEVLKDLGFEKDCAERGIPIPKEGEVRGPIFRKADELTGGRDFHSQVMPYGPLTLPRPVFLDMLRAKLHPERCRIRVSKRLIRYCGSTDGAPVTLHFEDGTTATADILIGSDGVHSMVRATMFAGNPRHAEPKWSGEISYRTQCLQEDIRQKYPNHQALGAPKLWCGKDKHVVSNPFGNIVHLICYYAVPGGEGTRFSDPWVQEVTKAEVIDMFKGWEPDLISLLSFANNPSRWAIHVVDPLPHSTSGKVALLGDAAHAMTPHQGVGGGQAIEDAFILGKLIIHPNTMLSNIEHVLKIYEQVRLPFAQEKAVRSKENGMMYHFLHPDIDLDQVGQAIGDSFAWLGHSGCYEEWNNAELLLMKETIE